MNFTVREDVKSRRQSTGKNATAELRYIITGTISAAAWGSGATYAKDAVVSRDDSLGNVFEYLSLQDGNHGNDPLSSPAWWGEIDQDASAKNALGNNTTVVYQGLVRTSHDVDPLGTYLWEGTAQYGRFDWTPPEVGEEVYRFQTGGGTQHITQSIQTRGKYAPQGDRRRPQGRDRCQRRQRRGRRHRDQPVRVLDHEVLRRHHRRLQAPLGRAD